MFDQFRRGAVRVIVGKGPLNHESASAAQNTFSAALSDGPPHLVFDMSGLLLIDGAGLELLLDIQARCSARGGALRLARPNELCQDILRITGIGPRFDLYDDVTTAIGGFAV